LPAVDNLEKTTIHELGVGVVLGVEQALPALFFSMNPDIVPHDVDCAPLHYTGVRRVSGQADVDVGLCQDHRILGRKRLEGAEKRVRPSTKADPGIVLEFDEKAVGCPELWSREEQSACRDADTCQRLEPRGR